MAGSQVALSAGCIAAKRLSLVSIVSLQNLFLFLGKSVGFSLSTFESVLSPSSGFEFVLSCDAFEVSAVALTVI